MWRSALVHVQCSIMTRWQTRICFAVGNSWRNVPVEERFRLSTTISTRDESTTPFQGSHNVNAAAAS
ncbi:unnamed protein product [Anisakis simplex]|uniref:Secreted protein n=1 Tax=Anisakis simplex TaxID=6269 RepID=A0A0M3JFW5_ANISI|nr:unnamed protein product [Anisakis simplex]